ncbi:MAG: TIGR03905 family TSCPD domain-containing protein [Clostridia bacterium]|nr:TIGR03905 family TSCPD domain-containing protein [Clostridia bacterium]
MHKTYVTKGVCSRQIDIELDENGVITECKFLGGCNGNTQGVAALVIGMSAKDAIARLEGIKCGPRATSCPDQLATALKEMVE